ncbi:MAG: multidrug transporter [Deltaproteobacteria bacterium]|nr:multidrug transporter [Deltaproteobacteria bacterium]
MHIGHRYRLWQTISWSRTGAIVPFAWALVVTAAFAVLELHWLAVPTLPMSLVGIAVAFYLGFKNNASYERLWEARKIWGAIVNASRSWAFGSRDLLTRKYGGEATDEELDAIRTELVHRHIAWMDALRHQLRKVKTWEHDSDKHHAVRKLMGVVEYEEDVEAVLADNICADEVAQVTGQINPAAHLLANQSRMLAQLRERDLIDGFGHIKLQQLLDELMAQQGKAERIKNFPFPRQYATVNSIFAYLFAALVPFALLREFNSMGEYAVWMTVPFATIVSWVFLTADKIGDWSENPFEGLANDVPITSMARGIERDIRQIIGETELPEARKPTGMIQF